MTGTSTFRPVSSMFNMLVNLFDQTSNIQPDIADSWQVAPDGLSVTMKLHPGVKFQDGTDLDANAVVFSFERMLNKQDPNYYGPYAFPSFFYATYKASTAVDPQTVRFDLTQPDATFLSALVWNTGSIVSPTAAKSQGKDFQNQPVRGRAVQVRVVGEERRDHDGALRRLLPWYAQPRPTGLEAGDRGGGALQPAGQR